MKKALGTIGKGIFFLLILSLLAMGCASGPAGKAMDPIQSQIQGILARLDAMDDAIKVGQAQAAETALAQMRAEIGPRLDRLAATDKALDDRLTKVERAIAARAKTVDNLQEKLDEMSRDVGTNQIVARHGLGFEKLELDFDSGLPRIGQGLTPDQLKQIAELVATAELAKLAEATVYGYASVTGGPRANRELAQRRGDVTAKALAEALLAAGVNPDDIDITVVGMGEGIRAGVHDAPNQRALVVYTP